ncbi:MAG: FAA hydrolase family protein [Gemmatimonadales bacterium]|nr:MAG: FAA hydrolase family protein [Gemmatimonadales bacterium]
MLVPPAPTKILCVGRNYLDHARELGNEPPAEPLFFLKPPSALVADGEAIVLPPGVGRVDFEGEVAFVVGRRTRGARPDQGWEALSHVLAMNDVTARDLQRTDGQWTRAKGFDTFAPAGEPVPLSELRARGLDPARLQVETRVNGELRQSGGLEQLVFPVPELVAWISGVMTLEPGDLLLTGTPAGVGPLSPGDEVEVRIPGVGAVRNPVRLGGTDPAVRV